MASPLLDLDTLIEPRSVRIDGEDYELLLGNSLPLTGYLQLNRFQERIGKIVGKPETEPFTELDEMELSSSLRSLVKLVLKAPPDVHARLKNGQLLDIYSTFRVPTLPQIEQASATSPMNGKNGKSKKKTKPPTGVN